MVKRIIAGLIIICCVVIIVSFFAPWARAGLNVTKVAGGLMSSTESTLKSSPFAKKFIKGLNRATSAVGGLGDIEVKTQVSGYDIPTLVNKKSSRTAISLVQIFAKDVEGLDKKALLVYLLPLGAVLCIFLAISALKNIWAVVPMAVISGTVSLVGLFKLITLDLSSLQIEVTIMNGLWQTLYGYLLVFVLSIIFFAADRRAR